MKALPKPPFQARAVFEACARSRQDKLLVMRLLSVSSAIEEAESNYQAKGHVELLHEIKEQSDVEGKITKEEMESLYQESFARKGSRHIYDRIKMGSPGDICPLCEQGLVSTLDHYLAKAKHPTLAVTPLNLIPACSDCNKLKLAHQPASAGEQTFHPYFDNIGEEIWLIAIIGETKPPFVSYSIKPPNGWDTIKQERLRTHFKTYKLADLYGANASADLVGMRFGLRKIGERGGSHGVREHLEWEAESRTHANPNSWKAAMFRALAASQWFYEEGYLQIA